MNSYLSIQTPFDTTVSREHKFQLHHVQGNEEICGDFNYRLNVGSLERLTREEMEGFIGNSVTAGIRFLDRTHQPGIRYINGIVYQLRELGNSRAPLMPEIWRYELVISSWMKQLEYVRDCRIFQKKGSTSMDIITGLLQELNLRDFKNETRGVLPPREYTVMYNETIGNFIQRLMQEDGIIWRFEHSETRHTLVFSSDSTDVPEIAGRSWGEQDEVNAFCREDVYMPVKDNLIASYNWESVPVKRVLKSVGTNKAASLPSFVYPADFFTQNEGEKKSVRYKQALQGKISTFHGKSTVRAFTAGYRFKLVAPTLPELHDRDYLIKKLTIEADEKTYNNQFVVLPAGQHYLPLPEKNIQKPIIAGTQTALVVGEKEAGKPHTERLGRVKIRFHWDHYSPGDSSHTSAYVRVAQPAAGGQRGFIFTPRVGEEVIVSFEDGNPEKPLIIGSTYSRINPPYKLPMSQPFTGMIKSDGDGDSNRITFADRSELEDLEFNAKKDLHFQVGHDLNIEVQEDLIITINDETINATDNITTAAGGSIISGTGGPMSDTAGSDISSLSLGGIAKVAGGAISNLSGATMINTAISSMNNKSGGAFTQLADTILAYSSEDSIVSTAEQINHEGKLLVSNISGGDITNTAGEEIKHKTMMNNAKVDETSSTDSSAFKIKGMMTNIN